MLFSLNSCAEVTIGFGRPNVTVVESVERFMMCVVKDRATVQSAVVTITDMPGSAEQNIGMSWIINWPVFLGKCSSLIAHEILYFAIFQLAGKINLCLILPPHRL